MVNELGLLDTSSESTNEGGGDPGLVIRLSSALKTDRPVHFLHVNLGENSQYVDLGDGGMVVRENDSTGFDELQDGVEYAVFSGGVWYVGSIKLNGDTVTMYTLVDHDNVFSSDAEYYKITHHMHSFDDGEGA